MLVRKHFKNLSRAEEELVQDYLAQKLDRLHGLLRAHYPDEDTVKLEAHAERFDKHQAYQVEIHLKVPKLPTFIAKDVKHHLPEVMDLVLDSLNRRVRKGFDKSVKI